MAHLADRSQEKLDALFRIALGLSEPSCQFHGFSRRLALTPPCKHQRLAPRTVFAPNACSECAIQVDHDTIMMVSMAC